MDSLITVIIILVLMGSISLIIANQYFDKAFWLSEELWLEEDDVNEDVNTWMEYYNFYMKCTYGLFIIATLSFLYLGYKMYFQ